MNEYLRRKIRLLGVPMDLGAGRRGVDMGPSALRLAGLGEALERLGHCIADDGDLAVPAPEARASGESSARYLASITKVCNRLRGRVARILEEGETPLVLGGDHSISAGSISGVAEHFRGKGQQVGVLWVDAHADMNTPSSSPSGNVHGMPLSSLLGHGPGELTHLGGFAPKLDPAHVCLIGIRDLDPGERELIRTTGVNAYTMRDIDERGIAAIAEEAIARATEGTAGLHVSFDLDGLDPKEAPGVGTPVQGGISWREANLLLELVSDSNKMVSMEVTELNPILDVKNQSGEVARSLVESAFGKHIL